MTFKVLKHDTQKIVCRFNSRPCNGPLIRNLCINPTSISTVLKSQKENFSDDDTVSTDASIILDDSNYHDAASVPTIETSNLVGMYFLMIMLKDSKHLCAKVFHTLDSHQDNLNYNTTIKELITTHKDGYIEDIIRCHDILDHIQNQDDQDQIEQRFKRIASHEGPLPRKDPYCNRLLYNVVIEWENGEITLEPMSKISADNPTTCNVHVKDHDFLENLGWKQFECLAKRGTTNSPSKSSQTSITLHISKMQICLRSS